MNERRQEKNIKEHLQQSEVQDRILRDIHEARSKAAVTISRAANLFNFTENQLREWEKRGLLQTERAQREKEGRDSTSHRQYLPAELDKLAIIRELMNQGYSPGDIPLDIDKLWSQIVDYPTSAQFHTNAENPPRGPEKDHLPIDQRIEVTDQQEFWRYFVSQALRLSLSLICQDIPDTLAGLVLPLEDRKLAGTIALPSELHRVGPALVGWLGRNRSFYTFLDDAPTFEYPSDFRLETLTPLRSQSVPDGRVPENISIVLQRRARPLSLSHELITTVSRILDLVYTRLETWQPCFDYANRDWLYQAHDLERVSHVAGDRIFNSLLERILELDTKGKHWSFCALLLPTEASLPLQQQSLIVRAQTEDSPYKIGMTAIVPGGTISGSSGGTSGLTDSLSLKAFQSGQIISIAEMLPGQSMVTYQLPPSISRGHTTDILPLDDLSGSSEKATRSAIAMPILGEYGIPAAVLYIAAEQTEAFTRNDQRVLRVIGKMIEELLLTSLARRQTQVKQGNIITQPTVVDATFQDFGSETDFLSETELLLGEIGKKEAEAFDGFLSIISFDIDNHSSIALKYGNRVARSLSQQAGERIKGQIRISNRYASGKLFHISADRYYLLMRISLEEAHLLAKQLKEALQGDYLISPSYTTPSRPAAPTNMLKIADVTLHVGVNSYPFEHLRDLLKRYDANISVRQVQTLLMAGVEAELELGRLEGGDCLITWDASIWGYKRLD